MTPCFLKELSQRTTTSQNEQLQSFSLKTVQSWYTKPKLSETAACGEFSNKNATHSEDGQNLTW